MNIDATRDFFATVPKGIEDLLADELTQLGALSVKPITAGVAFCGTLETAYRVCLWSRLASRVLMPVSNFIATDPDQLYAASNGFPWEDHFSVDQTFAVEATLVGSKLNHSHYAALRVKDGVVDRFRDRGGDRPSIDTHNPDLRINMHLRGRRGTLSLDLSGESLHRRGYRQEKGVAPLKESLAAAVLLQSGWQKIAADGGPFCDPMCGSGTLPLEAAMIAADMAPGLLRERFGFMAWIGHDDPLWQRLHQEATSRRAIGLQHLPKIIGFDADPLMIRNALINAELCGLEKVVHFEKRSIQSKERLLPESFGRPGLVAVNPPYGERLGQRKELYTVYRSLGERLLAEGGGWRATVLTSDSELGNAIGLKPHSNSELFNGAIPCRLLQFDVPLESEPIPISGALSAGAEMFANRLRKNLKRLGRWAKRQSISCYRLYDADMPEYSVAIDLYGDAVHVQEYAPPDSIDPVDAHARLQDVLAVIPDILSIPPEKVFLKLRLRQRGKEQYQRQAQTGAFFEVEEEGARLLVNLTDYLDTGLFLDHRPVRRLIKQQAAGKRFLNLFAYTATASVQAALGGAISTTSVDMSYTYLGWGKRNFELNGMSPDRHRLIQGDCLEWMTATKERFDLIFLDPPTFSNSKRMEESFDIQRDHVPLVLAASRLLADGGILIFSTNKRRFKLDTEALSGLKIKEITKQTFDEDFARRPQIHSCFWITR
ncbi:MAG: bifunctional 23S rRNA (guanine(2069)-N(7))-methyltransferase RlmK/23S rRNA (guanine(2445)-N(2))-methyltransferase RlmL [Desulfuromonadales bacterium]|nr:bifunctional 23S rRNA (guanine(2069)-N(7))-methyltransferase RlmK/23S rRNA (guanine(2445)-N(2))-methyltransferase RlmL [Desulfuromonadales bacterium]